jgi:LacI family transcriptional regulator
MPPKKSTIKDIALMAGVSIGTVDRVIHRRGEVAEKTKLKVQQILKETNYSPNVMAQVLKSSIHLAWPGLLRNLIPSRSHLVR